MSALYTDTYASLASRSNFELPFKRFIQFHPSQTIDFVRKMGHHQHDANPSPSAPSVKLDKHKLRQSFLQRFLVRLGAATMGVRVSKHA